MVPSTNAGSFHITNHNQDNPLQGCPEVHFPSDSRFYSIDNLHIPWHHQNQNCVSEQRTLEMSKQTFITAASSISEVFILKTGHGSRSQVSSAYKSRALTPSAFRVCVFVCVFGFIFDLLRLTHLKYLLPLPPKYWNHNPVLSRKLFFIFLIEHIFWQILIGWIS